MHGDGAGGRQRKRAREEDSSDSDASSGAKDEAPQKRRSTALSGGQQKPRGGKPVGMSGYKGVTLKGNRWAARGSKEGKQHHLGSFVNPEEAYVAVRHFEETGEKKPEWSKVSLNSVFSY